MQIESDSSGIVSWGGRLAPPCKSLICDTTYLTSVSYRYMVRTARRATGDAVSNKSRFDAFHVSDGGNTPTGGGPRD